MTGTPGRKRRPTQSDVARHAGVSQAAVSQALNNSTAITIPAETRQRIMAAITELGYVPDEMARSLRSRKSRTIASIIPDITNPFYPAFTRILSIIAGAFGDSLAEVWYTTQVCSSLTSIWKQSPTWPHARAWPSS